MSAIFVVQPGGRCDGEVVVPGDKSISHRALMFAGLAQGVSEITGLLESEDCLATRDAMASMGVTFTRHGPGHYHVVGAGKGGLAPPLHAVDCGNSGTGMRLLAGLLVGQNLAARLVGDASLMSRPMGRIAQPLRAMGALVTTAADGCPPIDIAPAPALRAMEHRPAVASAQVKSALLLAALGTPGVTRVIEPAATRDHSERLLGAFGVEVTVDGLAVSLRGPQSLSACQVAVPSDPSSAAFFVVAATLMPHSDLTLRNVGINPSRSGFLDILDAMGASIERFNLRQVGDEPVCDLRVRSAALSAIDVPPAWVPRTIDEFPVLFVAAAVAQGTTRVTGAKELRVKESDRLSAMAEGLTQLGITARLSDDGIEIDGGTLRGGEVASHGDHRIAMAFAVAGAVADGAVRITDTENVATSFPEFAALARDIGWRVHEQ